MSGAASGSGTGRKKGTTTAKGFQKTATLDDMRWKRQQVSVQLRKEEREEALRKKKVRGANGGDEGDQKAGSAAEPVLTLAPDVKQQLEAKLIQPTDMKTATNPNLCRSMMPAFIARIKTRYPGTTPELLQQMEALPLLLNGLNESKDARVVYESATGLRQLMSMDRIAPMEEVIRCNVVPKLVQLLGDASNPKLQHSVAWTLTNIAASKPEHTAVVAKSGAVRLMVDLLRHPQQELRDQVVWCLGNIAGCITEHRDIVLAHGIIDPITALCNPQRTAIKSMANVCWLMMNLAQTGKGYNKWIPPQEMVCKFAPAMLSVLNELKAPDPLQHRELVMHIAATFSYLSDDTTPKNQHIEFLVRSPGFLIKMFEMLMYFNSEPDVLVHLLKTLGNLCSGESHQTQAVVSCGALKFILPILKHIKPVVRRHALFFLSNIAADSELLVNAMIEEKAIFPTVGQMLVTEQTQRVRLEAAWVLANAMSSATGPQARYFLENDIFRRLCEEVLNKHLSYESKFMFNVIEAIDKIMKCAAEAGDDVYDRWKLKFEEYKSIDALEELQRYENDELARDAQRVLKNHFETEEEGASGPPPGASSFAFGPPPAPGARPGPGFASQGAGPGFPAGPRSELKQMGFPPGAGALAAAAAAGAGGFSGAAGAGGFSGAAGAGGFSGAAGAMPAGPFPGPTASSLPPPFAGGGSAFPGHT